MGRAHKGIDVHFELDSEVLIDGREIVACKSQATSNQSPLSQWSLSAIVGDMSNTQQ